MENLWAFLVCQIYANNYQFTTVKGLQSAPAKHGVKLLIEVVVVPIIR
uniref:Transposase n=1 Tax=Heterorhabditis bacteriophora TaxID=37862 RepID=A0A1I7WV55_HETBA